MNYKLSFIIPVYNRANYLSGCLDSVINQSVDIQSNIEIIIVNDGSTDNSEAIAKKYQDKFPNNIQLYSEKNKGKAGAVNFALNRIRGEFVTVLDSDDYVSPDFFKFFLQGLESNPEAKLFAIRTLMPTRIDKTDYRTFNENPSNFIFSKVHPLDFLFDYLDHQQLPANELYSCCKYIFHHSLNRFPFPENIIRGDDGNFWLQCLNQVGSQVFLTNSVYYLTRDHQPSMVTDSAQDPFHNFPNFKLIINNPKLFSKNQLKIFAQHYILYTMNWHMKKNKTFEALLDQNTYHKYLKKTKEYLSYIDYESIVSNPFFNPTQKYFLTALKFFSFKDFLIFFNADKAENRAGQIKSSTLSSFNNLIKGQKFYLEPTDLYAHHQNINQKFFGFKFNWVPKEIIKKNVPAVDYVNLDGSLTKLSSKFLLNQNISNYDDLIRELTQSDQKKLIFFFNIIPDGDYQLNSFWAQLLTKNEVEFLTLTSEYTNFLKLHALLPDLPILYSPERIGKNIFNSDKFIFLHPTRRNEVLNYIKVTTLATHIYVGHGISQKNGIASKIMRTFDHYLVSGQAQIDLFTQRKIKVTDDYFYIIGRPEIPFDIQQYQPNQKINTVLYAPTFSGGLVDQDIDSLDIGLDLVKFLDSSGYQIIFRPHKLSLDRSKSFGKKDAPRVKAINDYLKANSNESKKHIFGKQATTVNSLYDCFNQADVIISDISSVSSDALATLKPILCYNYLGEEKLDYFKKWHPIANATYIYDQNLEKVTKIFQQLENDDPLYPQRKEYRKYFLSDSFNPELKFLEVVNNFLK